MPVEDRIDGTADHRLDSRHGRESIHQLTSLHADGAEGCLGIEHQGKDNILRQARGIQHVLRFGRLQPDEA